jgi:hypothetical protein
MKNVVCFPAIHFVAEAYWHGGAQYPDLATLQDSLAETDLVRAVAWQQRRERWLAAQRHDVTVPPSGEKSA